jgi:hypothetical protein
VWPPQRGPQTASCPPHRPRPPPCEATQCRLRGRASTKSAPITCASRRRLSSGSRMAHRRVAVLPSRHGAAGIAMVSSAALLRRSGMLAVTPNAEWVRIASSCGPLAWPAIGRHCRQSNAQLDCPFAPPRNYRAREHLSPHSSLSKQRQEEACQKPSNPELKVFFPAAVVVDRSDPKSDGGVAGTPNHRSVSMAERAEILKYWLNCFWFS